MSSEQDEQTRKYDRQLRLWGAHGQAALMGAHILLVGAGPAGTEALKNLVLPGAFFFFSVCLCPFAQLVVHTLGPYAGRVASTPRS